MAAKITKTELITLSIKNSRSAIIIFVPSLCRLHGRLLNNDYTIDDETNERDDIRATV